MRSVLRPNDLTEAVKTRSETVLSALPEWLRLRCPDGAPAQPRQRVCAMGRQGGAEVSQRQEHVGLSGRGRLGRGRPRDCRRPQAGARPVAAVVAPGQSPAGHAGRCLADSLHAPSGNILAVTVATGDDADEGRRGLEANPRRRGIPRTPRAGLCASSATVAYPHPMKSAWSTRKGTTTGWRRPCGSRPVSSF